MNGLEDYGASGQQGEGRRKRRVELEEEKRLVASQLQELNRRLPQLEAQHKRGGVSKMGAPGKPSGNVSKKRPAQGTAELSGGAKRQHVEAERQKRVNQIWAQCHTILKALLKSKDAFAFQKPVNPITAKCPDYYDIIKRPMDLGTIQKKFPGRKPAERKAELREYKSPLEFRDDVRLVWSNCRDYNAVGHPVRTMGDALSEQWEKRWTLSGIEAKWEDELRKQELEESELAGGNASIPQKLQTLEEELQLKLQHAEQRPGYAPPQEGSPMSFEQKRRLSIALGQLPGDKVAEVVRIIAEGPSAKNDNGDGEMEVNIDELDTDTLWMLEKYSSQVLQVIRKKGGASSRAAEGTAGPTGNGNDTFNVADGEEPPGANGAAGSLSSNTSSDSDTDRSQSGSEGEVGSKNLGDSQQSNGILTSKDPPRTGGGNDAATLVSATRPPGQPQIVKNMANKKEVKLQNANAWADLTNAQPDAAAADPVADGGAEEDVHEDNLWAEFQSREQEQQARDDEKRAQEERLRQEQQKAEEAARAEAERLKKEAVAEEAARKKEEEERINAERKKELDEMQQVGKATDFSASALDMISNKGQAQVLSSVFGLQRKDEDSDEDSDNDGNPPDPAEEGEVS